MLPFAVVRSQTIIEPMKRRYKILLVVAGHARRGRGRPAAGAQSRLGLRHCTADCRRRTPMKGWVHRCYGGPEIVQYEELRKARAAKTRVIVKVRAASVNPLDWHYMRGKPYIMRMMGSGTRRAHGSAVGRGLRRRRGVGRQERHEVQARRRSVRRPRRRVLRVRARAREPQHRAQARERFVRAGGRDSDRGHHRAAGAARQRKAQGRRRKC